MRGGVGFFICRSFRFLICRIGVIIFVCGDVEII